MELLIILLGKRYSAQLIQITITNTTTRIGEQNVTCLNYFWGTVLATWLITALACFCDEEGVNWEKVGRLYLIMFPTTLALGIILLVAGFSLASPHNRADDIFKKASLNVFLNIKQIENGSPLVNYGTITTKDSTTIVVDLVPQSSKTKTVSNPRLFFLPTQSKADNIKVEGSFSLNKKNWCFVISDRTRSGIYNQTGYIAGFGPDSAKVGWDTTKEDDVCIGGIIFNQYGKEQYYTNRSSNHD